MANLLKFVNSCMEWKNINLSLGERAVKFMESEMAMNVREIPIGSNTSPRIKEYFSICTRLMNNKEVPIGITIGNWCSAAVSYSLYSSILDYETMPHGYRVGCVEIQADMQKNGLWRQTKLVKEGKFIPMVGDIVITDRSNPNDPSTSWNRHILRVYSYHNDGSFECISGNSGDRYSITKHLLNDKNLIGFGEYPNSKRDKIDLSIEDNNNYENLIDDFYNYYEKLK
ncbi:MAG: hypothetical protein LC122_12385 [Chitinophagales bacterium]|nr:hypothetical protein [Chitinophagales bacterium]